MLHVLVLHTCTIVFRLLLLIDTIINPFTLMLS